MRLPHCYVRCMPRAGHRISILLVAAASIALAGCGAERSNEPRTLSKREYIAQANDLQAGATKVFAALDGRLAATPAAAQVHVEAFDGLISGYEALSPPPDWRDEHAELIESLRTMRQAIVIVSRASARNRQAINTQVARFEAAQTSFEQAVRSINASR